MALLYCEHDRIGAAALACDQAPYGDEYWDEIHPGAIETGSLFETAYVTVTKPELQRSLLQLGIDDTSDGVELAHALEASIAPDYTTERAA